MTTSTAPAAIRSQGGSDRASGRRSRRLALVVAALGSLIALVVGGAAPANAYTYSYRGTPGQVQIYGFYGGAQSLGYGAYAPLLQSHASPHVLRSQATASSVRQRVDITFWVYRKLSNGAWDSNPFQTQSRAGYIDAWYGDATIAGLYVNGAYGDNTVTARITWSRADTAAWLGDVTVYWQGPTNDYLCTSQLVRCTPFADRIHFG